jgi:hypothetical protein
LSIPRFGDAFRDACEVAGIRGYTFHGLRHYGISRAVASGANPGLVSRTAGHASVAFTLSTYHHLDLDQLASLADVVEDELGATFATVYPSHDRPPCITGGGRSTSGPRRLTDQKLPGWCRA